MKKILPKVKFVYQGFNIHQIKMSFGGGWLPQKFQWPANWLHLISFDRSEDGEIFNLFFPNNTVLVLNEQPV
jgi:hypothetical protein